MFLKIWYPLGWVLFYLMCTWILHTSVSPSSADSASRCIPPLYGSFLFHLLCASILDHRHLIQLCSQVFHLLCASLLDSHHFIPLCSQVCPTVYGCVLFYLLCASILDHHHLIQLCSKVLHLLPAYLITTRSSRSAPRCVLTATQHFSCLSRNSIRQFLVAYDLITTNSGFIKTSP